MKRFRQFLQKDLNIEAIKDEDKLSSWGIRVRYAPEPPDDFDEFEFGIDYKGEQDVAFLIAIEKGKIARMLFGKTVKDNPDMLLPMNDQELRSLLDNKGNELLEFFNFVTTSVLY